LTQISFIIIFTKENCNIHPVFGFYTQLSTEEWWRTVFKGSLAHLGIPDEDLELAFHNVYHNFDYQLLPLADRLLENLNKENTKIFAYTNSDERIHKALRDLDIDHFFDYVMTSAESGLEKPRLEGYIRLMQVAEIEDPKECLFIGDDFENDFYAPRQIGMKSILIGSHISVGSHLAMPDLSAVNNFLFRHRISRQRAI